MITVTIKDLNSFNHDILCPSSIQSAEPLEIILSDNGHRILFKNSEFKLNYQENSFQQLLQTPHPLLKALGKKKSTVLDACGGFGKDSFIMAHHGHQVTTCESNPVIFTLLDQAIKNYCAESHLMWTSYFGASQKLMSASSFDIVYLDPMFQIKRSAKPKIGMQIIQSLTTPTPAFNLWVTAYNAAKSRLVVKQHQQEPAIESLPKPHQSINGKRNIRYDIYLKD
ncbi:class I SAM-dependent methyltransferase [Candidatus Synchoanobacter obligatus]|uniref:Class I SAM-dependent methyltransferase n=1 Tax=Candidatus Synchoanobacter obligatus TaxID=2919597 RepID=A0ABT1L5G6_9GAMM|nr:class I SAM-dependent methyltransferase [Candidatus Synchoanobacter obligatus]MCP8352113.1 class I SAM-dependent methyltransferase [Candidatus Synchoanobacter obligatus]